MYLQHSSTQGYMFSYRTTHHLEVMVLQNSQMYPREIILPAKRELERRYRLRRINFNKK